MVWLSWLNEIYTYIYEFSSLVPGVRYEPNKGLPLLSLKQNRKIKMLINIMFLFEISSPVASKHFTLWLGHLWVFMAWDLWLYSYYCWNCAARFCRGKNSRNIISKNDIDGLILTIIDLESTYHWGEKDSQYRPEHTLECLHISLAPAQKS